MESAILQELESFILEFGNDFAFLERQKRVQIGNKDYYIDFILCKVIPSRFSYSQINYVYDESNNILKSGYGITFEEVD